jgi:hypothetical protein
MARLHKGSSEGHGQWAANSFRATRKVKGPWRERNRNLAALPARVTEVAEPAFRTLAEHCHVYCVVARQEPACRTNAAGARYRLTFALELQVEGALGI